MFAPAAALIGAATLAFAAMARSIGAAASIARSRSALRSRIETTSLSGRAVALSADSSSGLKPSALIAVSSSRSGLGAYTPGRQEQTARSSPFGGEDRGQYGGDGGGGEDRTANGERRQTTRGEAEAPGSAPPARRARTRRRRQRRRLGVPGQGRDRVRPAGPRRPGPRLGLHRSRLGGRHGVPAADVRAGRAGARGPRPDQRVQATPVRRAGVPSNGVPPPLPPGGMGRSGPTAPGR